MKDTNINYEYIFSAVPRERRKSTGELFFVMTGFALSSSSLTMGAELGQDMTFFRAAGACIVGNTVLFLLALFWGLLAWKHGRNAAFLIEKYLGSRISTFFACILIFFLILWIGVNGDILSKLCIAIFPSWSLPFAVTVVLMLLPVIYLSRWGWRGIVFFSRIFSGVILVLTLYCIAQTFQQTGGADFLLSYRPENNLPFLKAAAMTVGNFSLSTLMITNICRFAKSKRAVFLCVLTYTTVLLFCNLCGILMVMATGAHNFYYAIHLLRLVVPGFLWLLLCVYTTQNVNMYVGSLAVQKLFYHTDMGGNVSHSMAVCFIGGAAIIMGILGIDRYIGMFTGILTPLVLILTAATAYKIHKEKSADSRIP